MSAEFSQVAVVEQLGLVGVTTMLESYLPVCVSVSVCVCLCL